MSFLKFFGNPPVKTRKLEFYIRPVETRTTNISGGNNPRFVIHVAHISHIITYPSKEQCSKMALGEVGVSLP